MARDAIARLYDVEEDSVELHKKTGTVTRYVPGTITFTAKKGKLVDLDRLHQSIWATRLSGGTRMELNWLDVTAVGEVAVVEKEVILKVAGSNRHFVLTHNPKAQPQAHEKSPMERLREALDRGEKVVSVTGRLDGWSGHFPKFLSKLPQKPRRLLVKEFKATKQ